MLAARPETLIFLHIMKTGGLTVWDILRRQYRRNRTLKILGRRFEEHVEEIRLLDDARKGALDLIAGHQYFGLHSDLPRNSKYFTILRQPEKRVASLYYYLRDQAETDLRRPLGSMDITSFVASGLHLQSDNGQTRVLSGTKGVEFGGVNRSMLEKAMEHIERCFILAGTTEMFDQTLLLLADRMGYSMPCYVRQNVNTSRPKSELTDRELDAVRAHNQLDIELYEFVNERLVDTMKSEADFDDRLQRFRFLNRRLGAAFIYWGRSTKRIIDRIDRNRYEWLPS